MFGFSLPKLLFTAIAIALVIYGFRWISRMQQRNEQNVQQRKSAGKPSSTASSAAKNSGGDDIETMIECNDCGSYYVPGSVHICDK